MDLRSDCSDYSDCIIRTPMNMLKNNIKGSSNSKVTTITTVTKKHVWRAINTVLTLFPKPWRFPRDVLTIESRGRISAYDEKHLYNILRDGHLTKAYINIHGEYEFKNNYVSLVFYDIDFPGHLGRARITAFKIAERIYKLYHVKPYIQFSGAKGYHVLIPIYPVKCESRMEAKEFLRYLQGELAGRYIKYVDNHVLGDVNRMFRIPYSIHEKTGNIVEPLQKWNRIRLYVDDLYYRFKLDTIAEKHTIKKNIRIHGVRPEVKILIEKAKAGVHLEHLERLAILFELINNGYGDGDILKVFEKQDDYNPKLTLYMIRHARSRGYRPFRRERLHEILNRYGGVEARE